ncbi:MAG: serine hydrolase domain-containing protein [Myxococcota bacterium]
MILALLACKPPPEGDPGTSPSDTAVEEQHPELDALIADQMAIGHMPGLAVAVTRGDELVWAKGYGSANLESGAPVTPDTPFMLASVSKTVVVAALMQSVEAGLVDLDADVDQYLPFQVNPPDAFDAPVTLRQLLTHTSSISDRWSVLETLYGDGDSDLALGDFLADYLVEGGAYYDVTNYQGAPGEAWAYSNIGVSLAAYVLEAAGGEPFDAVTQRDLFDPLGMTSTAWHLADFAPDAVAMPYGWDGAAWTPYGQYGYPDYPDGQLRSSVMDLSRHLRAMATGGSLDGADVLQEGSLTEMRTAQVPSLEPSQGLVWFTWDDDGTWWGHDGADLGVATTLGYRLDDGLGYIVLTNTDWNDIDAMLAIKGALITTFE